MEISSTSVDDHLASVANDDPELVELVELVSTAMPDRRCELWEGVFWGGTEQTIIGIGAIEQPRPKGQSVRWFLVGVARQKRHLSVYVNAAEDGAYLSKNFADRLGAVKVGSANISITKLERLDRDGFAEMLARADELTPPDVD